MTTARNHGTPGHLRVMTWNLWWRFGPWAQREVAIRSIVQAQSPDVLLLQEVLLREEVLHLHPVEI